MSVNDIDKKFEESVKKFNEGSNEARKEYEEKLQQNVERVIAGGFSDGFSMSFNSKYMPHNELGKEANKIDKILKHELILLRIIVEFEALREGIKHELYKICGKLPTDSTRAMRWSELAIEVFKSHHKQFRIIKESDIEIKESLDCDINHFCPKLRHMIFERIFKRIFTGEGNDKGPSYDLITIFYKYSKYNE